MGLPKILVTDFFNNQIITVCHSYRKTHQTTSSHILWTIGIDEGMKRSLQEYLPSITTGNDKKIH